MLARACADNGPRSARARVGGVAPAMPTTLILGLDPKLRHCPPHGLTVGSEPFFRDRLGGSPVGLQSPSTSGDGLLWNGRWRLLPSQRPAEPGPRLTRMGLLGGQW